MKQKTMLTDLYQLTMNAAYFGNDKDDEATFDLFIRKLPEDWGFFIANGIEDAIDYATSVSFTEEDIAYLREQGLFSNEYLDVLRDFRFEGDICAVQEGTPVGANTPILRVTGSRMQAQFLETTLLNIINFQTLIATKANRVVSAAGDARVVDFGLRRAQEEDAAMKGARAAYIGGVVGTSNVKAGKEYGIPIVGTHAHSFVMSFSSEIDAFRAYVKTFPDNATLLIDTYDTIEGARNASIVAKELEANGKRLGAVRLDSGDLTDLSKDVRDILDGNGLSYVKIVASNDLNEYKIAELRERGARIDAYGVGTEMITAKPVAAIPGVYKLVEDTDGAKIKLAPGKKTIPGKKQVYRLADRESFFWDVLTLENEHVLGEALLQPVVIKGERVAPRRSLENIRTYTLQQVALMPVLSKGIRAAPYEVKLSKGLEALMVNLEQRRKTQ